MGGGSAGRKGSQKERELRRAFESAGWFAIRSPGSSGGYDLIAAKNGHIIVIELKYVSAGETVYFSNEELFGPNRDDGGLIGVAEEFGGHAYAAVRWKRDTTFYGMPVDLLDRTSGGNPKMDPDNRDDFVELPLGEPPTRNAEAVSPDDVGVDSRTTNQIPPDVPDESETAYDEDTETATGTITVRVTEDTTE